MFFKKAGGSIFGVQLNKAEQKALDREINRQIVEHDQAFDIDKEATILWVLATQFGFGPKRLKRAFNLFRTETIRLWQYYQMEPEEAGWIARYKLKEKGVDVEQWFKEQGEQ